MKLDLLKKIQKLNGGLDFMDGKEKGEIVLGATYHINEFGFLNGEQGEYVVFTTKGNESHFFFGASVLTEKLKQLESILTDEELKEALNEGIEVIFNEKKSEKSKRKYITCTFFPSAE